MEKARVEAGRGRACRMLQCLFAMLLATVAAASAAVATGTDVLSVDLGDIHRRPTAPEFEFERFFQTRPLGQFAFSADNRCIYFLDSDGTVDNVFSMDLTAGSQRQLTHFTESLSGFLVDHQGRFLIVVHDIQGNEDYDLYRFDLRSGEVHRLTNAGSGDRTQVCGLSPDDSTVYYAQTRDQQREAGLWQLDIDSGKALQLLPGDGRTLDCDAVSEDGRYLLFGELAGFDERYLGLLDLATGRTRTIIAAPGINNVDAGFAGNQVYFLSALHSNRFRLWRYRIGDTAAAPVRLPFDNDIESLSLQSGGRVAVIRYRSALAGRTAVFVDGFDRPLDFGLPAPTIMGAAFSDTDASLGVVFTEAANMPARYYLVGRGRPRLLYDANRSGINHADFSEARSLLVPSFDGLRIPVHLFIPNGTSNGAPRPAIFVIHGGPDRHLDPVYSSAIQFLTNRGFIVVAPNVRGSTGFGRRYAALDSGDWGGGHIRDIVEVAAAVRSLDFVDADNLFLSGMSFGGFSVMSLLTQYPDTFRAAVDFFGFTELASFVDSWPAYLQLRLIQELGFDPRIDRARNRAVSPLYHVDRISIPLQIHQGANDSRVPRSQSDWLVLRLRSLGRSVEYYVYADEGHGFTRFENERLAWRRLVEFFRRQLRSSHGKGVKGPNDSRCHHCPVSSRSAAVLKR
jgi:dipeptidyl aminopeptidase/acylaminoacyl peptidase